MLPIESGLLCAALPGLFIGPGKIVFRTNVRQTTGPKPRQDMTGSGVWITQANRRSGGAVHSALLICRTLPLHDQVDESGNQASAAMRRIDGCWREMD
jgi:hypothetical protein